MKTILLSVIFLFKTLLLAVLGYVLLRLVLKARSFNFLDISQNPFH